MSSEIKVYADGVLVEEFEDVTIVDDLTVGGDIAVGGATDLDGDVDIEGNVDILGSYRADTGVIDVTATGTNNFLWAMATIAASLGVNHNLVFFLGKEKASKNAGYFGYRYSGDHSDSNCITLGLHSVDNVLNITGGGNVGVKTLTPTQVLDINSDSIRLRTAKTPSSAADTGDEGEICWDSSYIYICVATDTWKRVAISTW